MASSSSSTGTKNHQQSRFKCKVLAEQTKTIMSSKLYKDASHNKHNIKLSMEKSISETEFLTPKDKPETAVIPLLKTLHQLSSVERKTVIEITNETTISAIHRLYGEYGYT